MRRAVGAAPCRSVARRTLIRLMPAILDPLIDGATHVVESEWIGFEAAHFRRLLGRDIAAILAPGHARLGFVAPPIFGLRSAAGGIFPFRFARKAIGLLRRL